MNVTTTMIMTTMTMVMIIVIIVMMMVVVVVVVVIKVAVGASKLHVFAGATQAYTHAPPLFTFSRHHIQQCTAFMKILIAIFVFCRSCLVQCAHRPKKANMEKEEPQKRMRARYNEIEQARRATGKPRASHAQAMRKPRASHLLAPTFVWRSMYMRRMRTN